MRRRIQEQVTVLQHLQKRALLLIIRWMARRVTLVHGSQGASGPHLSAPTAIIPDDVFGWMQRLLPDEDCRNFSDVALTARNGTLIFCFYRIDHETLRHVNWTYEYKLWDSAHLGFSPMLRTVSHFRRWIEQLTEGIDNSIFMRYDVGTQLEPEFTRVLTPINP